MKVGGEGLQPADRAIQGWADYDGGMAIQEASSTKSSWWLMAGVLMLVCLFVRAQGLMALPIFSDEAIYLRWGQLIQAGHWWVSLVDPKPPLHFWLIALVMNLTGSSADPLVGARWISVIAGVLSVPALMATCEEIGQLARPSSNLLSGRVVGLLAAVLMIFCPYVAFYQRLAVAEPLFILEMLIAIWLGLRWGRQVMAGKKSWPSAIVLGVILGLAMLTRQGFSYVLWAVPIVAVAMALNSRSKKNIFRAFLQLLTAGILAGLLWTPYLLAEFNTRAPERGGTVAELRARILYQDQFTGGKLSHLDIAARNSNWTFVPTWNADGQRVSGWIPLYMTGPLFSISLLGLLYMAFRRQWRILAIIGLWIFLMLGPPVLLGSVLRSRYIVPGVLPLLITAVYLIGELLGLLIAADGPPARQWALRILSGAALVALMVLPIRDVGLQSTQWWKQPLTLGDRYEYITGWTAGRSTMAALKFIKGYTEKLTHDGSNVPRSVVLITDNGWGLPSDGLWAYLSNNRIPNLDLYYTSRASDGPILTPATMKTGQKPDSYILRKDKWLYTPAEAVTFPSDASVLYITSSQGRDDSAINSQLEQLNPNLQPVVTFYGIEGSSKDASDHLLLFELK